MASLEAFLTAESAQIIDQVLTLLADAARDADRRAAGSAIDEPSSDSEPDSRNEAPRNRYQDERTHQQRRADALTGVFSAILDGRPLPLYPAACPDRVQAPIDEPASDGARLPAVWQPPYVPTSSAAVHTWSSLSVPKPCSESTISLPISLGTAPSPLRPPETWPARPEAPICCCFTCHGHRLHKPGTGLPMLWYGK